MTAQVNNKQFELNSLITILSSAVKANICFIT